MTVEFIQIAAAYHEARIQNSNNKLRPETPKHPGNLALSRKEVNSKYAQLLEDISTQLAGRGLKASSTQCPECYEHFSLITLDGQQVDFCRHCNSFWFDAGELKHFTDLFTDVPGDNLRGRESKYFCPICYARMRECVFLNRGNLLVDKCPNRHGVYLESGEFKRALILSNVP